MDIVAALTNPYAPPGYAEHLRSRFVHDREAVSKFVEAFSKAQSRHELQESYGSVRQRTHPCSSLTRMPDGRDSVLIVLSKGVALY